MKSIVACVLMTTIICFMSLLFGGCNASPDEGLKPGSRIKLSKRAIVIAIDATTFAPESQKWVERFLIEVRGNVYVEQAHIAVIQITNRPKLIRQMKGLQWREFESRLREAATQSPNRGSDIYSALAIGAAWLQNYEGSERYFIVVSDLIPDPETDKNGKVVRQFKDPFTFRFPPDTALLLYGLSPENAERTRATWGATVFLRNVPFLLDHVK